MTIRTLFWIFTAFAVVTGCPALIRSGMAGDIGGDPIGHQVLKTGRQMTLVNRHILVGGCWDYADAVYTRAGFPPIRRQIVFNGDQETGPFADLRLVRPGDWLYFINHQYGDVPHSAIFIDWIDFDGKRGLMLSYGGEHRRQPARYRPYDLSQTYMIIRPKEN